MEKKQSYSENPDFFGPKPEIIVEQMADLLLEGARILDVGAGQGRNTLPLARRGFQVYAIDPSEKGISQIQERSVAHKLSSVHACVARIETVPLPEDTYDAMCFINVLHFFSYEEAVSVIQKCQRATRNGGIHTISIFTDGTSDFIQTWKIKTRLWTQEELQTVYQGWEILDSHLEEGFLSQLNADGQPEPSKTIKFMAKKIK